MPRASAYSPRLNPRKFDFVNCSAIFFAQNDRLTVCSAITVTAGDAVCADCLFVSLKPFYNNLVRRFIERGVGET